MENKFMSLLEYKAESKKQIERLLFGCVSMYFFLIVLIFTTGCNELDRIMNVESEKPCREKCALKDMDWRMVRFENSIQCRCVSRTSTETTEIN
jgi:hypothetical protein